MFVLIDFVDVDCGVEVQVHVVSLICCLDVVCTSASKRWTCGFLGWLSVFVCYCMLSMKRLLLFLIVSIVLFGVYVMGCSFLPSWSMV